MKRLLLLCFVFYNANLWAQDSIMLVYQPPLYRFFYDLKTDSLDNSIATSMSDMETRNHAYILKDTSLINAFKVYCNTQNRYRSNWVGEWGFQYERWRAPSSLGGRSYKDTLIKDYKKKIFDQAEPYYLYEGLVPLGVTLDGIRSLLHAPEYYIFLEKGGGSTGSVPSIEVRFAVISEEKLDSRIADAILENKMKKMVAELEAHYKVLSWKSGGGAMGWYDVSTSFKVKFEAGTDLKGIELIVNKYQAEVKEIEKALPYWIRIASQEKDSEKAIQEINKICPLLEDVIKY